jgi:hypothetical protein
MPLYLFFFLPIALGHRWLYPWAHPADYASEIIHQQLAHARAWNTPAFFVARAYFYLAAWTLVSFVLRRASVLQDKTGEDVLTERQRAWSAATIPVVGITLTFAAFDWFMALVPAWSSDLYGVYFFAGGFVGAIGLVTVLVWAGLRARILPPEVGASHVSAIGRVLLTAVIFWTYIAATSLILIWIANLPREITFYLARVSGAWAVFSGVLVFGHFLVPFLLLLQRGLKRRPASLAIVGGWVLLMHALDAYWLVVPSMNQPPHLLDVGGFLAVAGVALAFGAWRFSLAEPYPIRDPNLSRGLRYESE